MALNEYIRVFHINQDHALIFKFGEKKSMEATNDNLVLYST